MAANKLMALSGVDAMVPVSDMKANIHVVTWKTPEAEAAGMAKAIVENIQRIPRIVTWRWSRGDSSGTGCAKNR